MRYGGSDRDRRVGEHLQVSPCGRFGNIRQFGAARDQYWTW